MTDKILLVDDEPDILDFFKLVLEDAGFDVATASNGEEALVKVQIEAPDLILLDLVMPGQSGLEVCKILKKQPTTKSIPVLIHTALNRDIDKKMSGEAGANGFFSKPNKPEDLTSMIGCIKSMLANKNTNIDQDQKVLLKGRQ